MSVFNIQDITISKGSHDVGSGQYCIMELVACVAGEAHTDAPTCVSPVYASFFRLLNDNLDDTKRQELKQYIPRLLNTKATPDVELKRMYFLANAAIKVFAVDALKKAGLTAEADELLALPYIGDKSAAEAAYKAAKAASTADAIGWAAAEVAWAARAADVTLIHNVINQLLEIR